MSNITTIYESWFDNADLDNVNSSGVLNTSDIDDYSRNPMYDNLLSPLSFTPDRKYTHALKLRFGGIPAYARKSIGDMLDFLIDFAYVMDNLIGNRRSIFVKYDYPTFALISKKDKDKFMSSTYNDSDFASWFKDWPTSIEYDSRVKLYHTDKFGIKDVKYGAGMYYVLECNLSTNMKEINNMVRFLFMQFHKIFNEIFDISSLKYVTVDIANLITRKSWTGTVNSFTNVYNGVNTVMEIQDVVAGKKDKAMAEILFKKNMSLDVMCANLMRNIMRTETKCTVDNTEDCIIVNIPYDPEKTVLDEEGTIKRKNMSYSCIAQGTDVESQISGIEKLTGKPLRFRFDRDLVLGIWGTDVKPKTIKNIQSLFNRVIHIDMFILHCMSFNNNVDIDTVVNNRVDISNVDVDTINVLYRARPEESVVSNKVDDYIIFDKQKVKNVRFIKFWN